MSIPLFILWLVSIPFLSSDAGKTNPPGNYFINCGSTTDVVFDGVKYLRDEGYISTGNITSLNRTDILPLLTTLRYFPSGSGKFCYDFPVIKGAKFLVRTSYFYGGFDGGDEPPVFDQIVDGTKWSTVNTTEDFKNGQTSYYEIIVSSEHTKTLSVCLARNEHTKQGSSPFISALEIQTLDDAAYNSTDFNKYGLITVARSDFASLTGEIIRFPDDRYNRYWQPFIDSNPIVEAHANVSSLGFWNLPPAKIFQSAFTTSRGKTLVLKWPPFSLPSNRYYIALYFQDNRTPSPYSWRVFTVNINGRTFYPNLNVSTKGVTVYGEEWPLSGQTEITLTPGQDMPVGPLINAGEVYQILPLAGRTQPKDVVALQELKKSLSNPPGDWYGDPCLPKLQRWSGIGCSEGDHIRVIHLDMTGLSLTGKIPNGIGQLTALTELKLSKNKLTGPLPDLSSLKSLEILHLDDNEFEGPYPESLGKLPRLRELFLNNNNLNGTLPSSLANRNDMIIRI